MFTSFVAKLFEKQRTNFYYNWLSFIEDFLKSFLVCFLMGHSVVCACVTGMGSKEKFLLHPEIIAELKTIPQVIIKREEAMQANVITRAQRLQKEREEAKASDEEEREDEGKNENESESDEQSDNESSITSDRIRQENDACESDNLLESEDSDEDMWDKGLPIANLFEEAEEDEEQVMQRRT